MEYAFMWDFDVCVEQMQMRVTDVIFKYKSVGKKRW